MVAASFAGCGLFLLILFATLVGCTTDYAPFVSAPNDPILCHCECPNPVGPNAVTSQNLIAAEPDDAVQAGTQTAADLDGFQLELGQGNYVGLRFQKVGIPPHATITAAHIQFTAAQPNSVPTALQIWVVDSWDAAPFTTSTNLQMLTLVNAPVPWQPGDWTANEKMDNEKTPDLAKLLQLIVENPQYTSSSAIAFVITGSGLRAAKSFEGSMTTPQPALLTVEYLPKPIQQDFLTCGDPADPTVCGGYVQTNVNAIATACLLGATPGCTCTKSGAVPSTFSQVCNSPCPAILLPPADCDPEHTALTTSQTPVCVTFGP
jgi:hypothetical protein